MIRKDSFSLDYTVEEGKNGGVRFANQGVQVLIVGNDWGMIVLESQLSTQMIEVTVSVANIGITGDISFRWW